MNTPTINSIANKSIETLLANKTMRYEVQHKQKYKLFKDWCDKKQVEVKNLTERVLLSYFHELFTRYKSSTLWVVYSVLKSTLLNKDGVDIAPFKKVTTFIKQQHCQHIAKTSGTFTNAEIKRFLIEAPNEKYLMMKVALIIGVCCGCRAYELTNMLVDHITAKEHVLVVEVPAAKTYKHRRIAIYNSFAADVDIVSICRTYFNLRPKHMNSRRLFVKYYKGKCAAQHVGHHTIGAIPAKIAEFLELKKSHEYIGTCYRRTFTELRHSKVRGDVLSLKLKNGQGRMLGKCKGIHVNIRDELDPLSSPSSSNINKVETHKKKKYNILEYVEPEINEVKIEIKDEPNNEEEEIWSEIKMEPEDITYHDERQNDPLQEEGPLMEIKQESQALDDCQEAEYNIIDVNQILHHSKSLQSEDNLICTSPEHISATADNATNKVLSTKSASIYENTFRKFMDWCSQQNAHTYTENELLAYFGCLVTERKLKQSSLWSHYSMLRATLSLKKCVDISTYSNLRAYLKKQGQDSQPKKSLTLSHAQFVKVLNDAPDQKYLATKIVMIFGIAGACRSDEMVKIKLADIEDSGSDVLVKITDSKLKKVRYFNIMGVKYLTLFRKYASLRPRDIETDRFFIKYLNGKCYKQVMGIHKIARASREAAQFLKLPNDMQYTGQCLQKTAATLLPLFMDDSADDYSGADNSTDSKQTTHHSDSVQSEDDLSTPPQPDFTETTDSTNNELPTKSATIYENTFEKFMDWCSQQNANNYTENVLLAYFGSLVTERKLKQSTLWSHYSMLRATLSLKKGVDISTYSNLRAYLKKQGEDYTPRKSLVLSKAQFDQFLRNAPDEKYLATKIVVIFGVIGACRCDEMVRIKLVDIEDSGSEILVKLMDSKTNKARYFNITDVSHLTLFRKYASFRPRDIETDRLFIKYINGKCFKQVMGVHKIARASREAAMFLKLPNHMQYTGDCLRKTAATFLKDDGSDAYLDDFGDAEYNIIEIMKSEDVSTPPEPNLAETADNATKTAAFDTDDHTFTKFMVWCSQRNKHDYSEEVLLAYFSECNFNNSSVWSEYSKLQSNLSLTKGMDISKYENLRAYLKTQGAADYKPKKLLVLSKSQLDKFLENAPDETHLATKVVMIFGIAGACRCDEMVNIKLTDIEDLGSEILVIILDSKTNNARYFNIVGITYLTLVRKYVALRPSSIETDRFFIKYQEGKCYNEVMGVHKIATGSREAALFLKLPNHMQYTGHFIRKTSGTSLLDDS